MRGEAERGAREGDEEERKGGVVGEEVEWERNRLGGEEVVQEKKGGVVGCSWYYPGDVAVGYRVTSYACSE